MLASPAPPRPRPRPARPARAGCRAGTAVRVPRARARARRPPFADRPTRGRDSERGSRYDLTHTHPPSGGEASGRCSATRSTATAVPTTTRPGRARAGRPPADASRGDEAEALRAGAELVGATVRVRGRADTHGPSAHEGPSLARARLWLGLAGVAAAAPSRTLGDYDEDDAGRGRSAVAAAGAEPARRLRACSLRRARSAPGAAACGELGRAPHAEFAPVRRPR